MNDFWKKVLSVLGIIFGILVLAFTGLQTWSLLYEASDSNAVTATLGLVFFEGGMLYWWYTLQRDAEGLAQMALSGLLAVFSLVLVAGATALHLGAVQGSLLGENTPARLITLAAVTNLVGKFFFALASPAVYHNIFQRALRGRIIARTFKDAEAKVDDLSAKLADRLSQELTRQVEVQMLTSFGLSHDLAKRPLLPATVPVTVHQNGESEETEAFIFAPPTGEEVANGTDDSVIVRYWYMNRLGEWAMESQEKLPTHLANQMADAKLYRWTHEYDRPVMYLVGDERRIPTNQMPYYVNGRLVNGTKNIEDERSEDEPVVSTNGNGHKPEGNG